MQIFCLRPETYAWRHFHNLLESQKLELIGQFFNSIRGLRESSVSRIASRDSRFKLELIELIELHIVHLFQNVE
jgi:hypothetical protein